MGESTNQKIPRHAPFRPTCTVGVSRRYHHLGRWAAGLPRVGRCTALRRRTSVCRRVGAVVTLAPIGGPSHSSRLAGYEDTNDAERLAQDPTMRIIVGRRDTDRPAASTNTMSRFETEVLTQDGNVEGLDRLNAKWVDLCPARRRRVILDMDSSESPVHGEQEGASYNGHFGSTCYHPLFVFNQR